MSDRIQDMALEATPATAGASVPPASARDSSMVSQVLHEDEVHLGKFFNISMIVAACSLILAGLVLIIGDTMNLFSSLPSPTTGPNVPLVGGIVALLLVPFPFIYIMLSRRGYVRLIIQIYLWAQILANMVLVFLLDGPWSFGWLLFSWSITMAGTLLKPIFSLVTALSVLAYYLLLLTLEALGIYAPVWVLDSESRVLFFIIFGLLIFFTNSGILTYINMQGFQGMLARSRTLTRQLEEQRLTLKRYADENAEKAERLARDFASVAELGRAASAIPHFQNMLQTAARIISRRFELTYVGIYLLDEEGEWLVLTAAALEGEAWPVSTEMRRQFGEEDVVAYAAEQDTLYVVPDVTVEPRYSPLVIAETRAAEAVAGAASLPEICSQVAVPLTEQGQVIGILDLRLNLQSAQSRLSAVTESTSNAVLSDVNPPTVTNSPLRDRTFSDLEKLVFRSLGDTLSLVIEHVRRYEEMRRTLRRLSEYEQREAAERWRQLLLGRSGRLAYLYDRVQVSPYSPEEDNAKLPFPLSELYGPYVHERSDGTYVLLVPLKIRNTMVGHLSFESDEPWPDEDVAMVDAIVAQLGLALENAQLLEETQRNALFEQIAGEVAARVRLEVEIESVLQRALEELGHALGVERGGARLALAQLRSDSDASESKPEYARSNVSG